MIDDYYKHLAGMMLKTRGSRFAAAQFLTVIDQWSVGISAFLSVYILAWSILQLALPDIITGQHARFFGVLTAIAALSILVNTLMDHAKGRSLLAQKLEQNAFAVSKIMRKLERENAMPAPNVQVLDQLAEEYEALNERTAANHTEDDYRDWALSRQKPDTKFAAAVYSLRRRTFKLKRICKALFVHFILSAGIIATSALYTVFVLLPDIVSR